MVKLNKKCKYLEQDYQEAQKLSNYKKYLALNKIKKEVKRIKLEKEKDKKLIEYFTGTDIKISNALCETAKQSFVSREIQRRKTIQNKMGGRY